MNKQDYEKQKAELAKMKNIAIENIKSATAEAEYYEKKISELQDRFIAETLGGGE